MPASGKGEGMSSGIQVQFSVLTLLLEVLNCNRSVDGRIR